MKKEQDSDEFQKPRPQEKKLLTLKTSFVCWIVFLFSLVIVLINLISVVFPALIASSNSTILELQDLGIPLLPVDSLFVGTLAYPLIATNVIVFGLTILYFKKRLPIFLTNSINFVFNFEVSRKLAFLTILAVLTIYVVSSAGELTVEEHWQDFSALKEKVDEWSPDRILLQFEPHVRYFLIWSSYNLFGYYTIIPFIASIALLLLTYFFTTKITGKRFAGIISMIVLLQSNVFLTYDSTVSYTNFWILLYLFSLFLVYKAWPLSPVSYLLSIFSKVFTAMFLPMSVFFIYRSDISKNKKIILAASSMAIILAGIIMVASGPNVEEFDSDEFWLGFTSFSYQLRFDGLILLFILPLIVGLFFAARNGIAHADSILVLIGGILLTTPFLTGFTELTNQPYRFVSVIVFFAVCVGVLLSKRQA